MEPQFIFTNNIFDFHFVLSNETTLTITATHISSRKMWKAVTQTYLGNIEVKHIFNSIRDDCESSNSKLSLVFPTEMTDSMTISITEKYLRFSKECSETLTILLHSHPLTDDELNAKKQEYIIEKLNKIQDGNEKLHFCLAQKINKLDAIIECSTEDQRLANHFLAHCLSPAFENQLSNKYISTRDAQISIIKTGFVITLISLIVYQLTFSV